MKNKLGFLGFLGFLGLLGLIGNNYVYFALFGFFYFFRYFLVIPDELFKENIMKAATPSFFVGMSIYVITIALTAFHVSTLILTVGLVAGFVVQFFVFTIFLVIFELSQSQSR